MLTDTHCHLFYDDLKNDLKGVLDRANQLGVTRFICVGSNIEDSRECLSIAEENNNKNCDSYSDYIEKAKLEWPKYRLVKLSSTLRGSNSIIVAAKIAIKEYIKLISG